MSEYEALRTENAVLIDVRSPAEFTAGHVEGARNIPLANLPAHLEELRSGGRPLVLYCLSGNRSAQAVAYLQNLGFRDIVNGGGWRELQHLRAGLNAQAL